MNRICLPLLIATISLSGCGWVDSTGRQAENSSTQGGNPNQNHLLNDGDHIAVNEQSSITITLNGESTERRGWEWLPHSDVDESLCYSVEGFDPGISTTTLGEACSDGSNCTIQFTETANASAVQFSVTLPALRAPAALAYELVSTDENGSTKKRNQTLCAVAINEAPDAADDQYKALYYRIRSVGSDDFNNLLSNDLDDNDDRNEPLRILPDPIQTPLYADSFTLGSDGSFSYRISEGIDLQPGERLSDSFTYAVSDGVHVSTATVTIVVTDENQSPRRLSRIPDIDFELIGTEKEIYLDITQYFFDGDADNLQYYHNDSSLFSSGSLSLSKEGILSGIATARDLGDHRLTVIVTDGLGRTSDTFRIDIEHGFDEENQAPVASDISNRIVQNQFFYDVSEFFFDADGDQLYFSAAGLPPFVSISDDGTISGISATQNRGVWFIVVTAIDGRGGSVKDGFNLSIN